jgi:hypothetical protein
MPLGIGAGLLSGAGQGLLDTQKLQQSQAEAQIRNLLLRRQLQKDQATEEADKYGPSLTGLFGTPGLAAPTPVGGAAPSSSPAVDLFGGGTTGTSPINYGIGGALTGQRPADTGYGPLPTMGDNALFRALPPPVPGFPQATSGPGYSAVTSPVDPSSYSGSQFHPERTRFVPGPNDRAPQFSARIGAAPTPAAATPTAQAPAEPASQSDGGLPDTVLPPDAGSGSSMPPRDAAATGRPGVTQAAYTPGAGDDAAPQQPGATRPGETRTAAELTVDPQTYARQGYQDLKAKINALPISSRAKQILWHQFYEESKPILQEYNRMWQQQEQQKAVDVRQQRQFGQQQQQQQRQFEQQLKMRQEAEAAAAKAAAERERFSQESQGWSIEHDPATGMDYRYNVRTNKATTLTGEPYTPQRAVKPGTEKAPTTLHNIEITDAEGKASPPFAARPSADSPSGFVKSDGTPVVIPEGGSLKMTGVGGQGRQAAAQIQSMIGASSELVGEARNLMELPSTSTAGVFQGLQNVPASELGEAVKRSLANTVAPETATDLKTSFQGVARSLATIEAQGRATGLVGLTGMSEQLMPQTGDSQGNVLRKMATLRQIMERNIDAIASSPNASKEQKDFLTKLRGEMAEVIPFTVSDVNKLQHGDKESIATAAKKFGLGGAQPDTSGPYKKGQSIWKGGRQYRALEDGADPDVEAVQ